MSQQLLTTAEVCKTLGITPSKLRRLTSEGYLEVEEIAQMKHGKMHLFKPALVKKLLPEMPRILRRWYSEENAQVGAKQAAALRANRRYSVQSIKSQKDEFLASLDLAPERIGRLMRASYYLFHLNHYAKAGINYLYDLKEQVLKCFVENYNADDGLKVYYVQGGQRVQLCPACKKKARRQRLSYGDYARATGGCSRCTKDDHFYSLYEFVLEYAEHRFCFHTPYTVARKWFKNQDIPIKFKASRYEMGTTFGRPVLEPEAKAIPLNEVVEELEKFLNYINDRSFINT
ncbi:hypothetical protein JOC37_002048 [Desulfohalotomaculum tongense]|uniref:helix-turn-helix domain-containing protein n=1 Tax=Desulforadius tongensis TaxID=1216062 RepID=UPI00195D6DA0|nr:helix-turn-helix domain-containing protein [Desulforadius tongensis]MBM7855643.1 hypothetical protein [Desulforadius tongensis]